MADLTDIQASQSVKISGANPSTGIEDNFAEVDSSGNLHVNLRDSSGNEKLGSSLSNASIPVVIASDQSPVNVDLIGLPNFQTHQYTVGLTAVQLTTTPLTNRSGVSIKFKGSNSNAILYIGNSNSVTSTTGYPLFDKESINMDLTSASTIWVIGSSIGQTVFVMEIGG
jgi:hypothetical protein